MMERRCFSSICMYFVFGVVLVLGGPLVFAAKQSELLHKSIAADAEIQAEITRTVILLSAEEMLPKDVANIAEQFKSFKKHSREELLFQLLLSYGGRAEHQQDPKKEMGKRLLIYNIVQDIPGERLVKIMVPHLEETTDPILKKSIARALELVAFKKDGDTEFSDFTAYLAEHKDAIPQSLLSFMYNVDAKKAVLLLTRLYEGEDAFVELNQTLRMENAEVLDRLSKSDKWWKEFYVTRTMQKSRRLKSDVLIARLEKSNHPMVKNAIQELKEKSQAQKDGVTSPKVEK